MKEADFFKAFHFTQYRFERYHYTDARSGTNRHFIGMLEEGRCRIVAEGITVEAGPGEPFYIPRALPYQSYWFSEGRIRLRSYGFDCFPEETEASYPLQKLPGDLAEQVRRIPTRGRPDSAALGAFFSVLGQALGQMQRSDREPAQCLWQQAVAYLREHRDCRVAEVARSCGVSESALYASFKRHGSTPNELRQALLVEEAVRLLSTTDAPVQEISDGLGFSSASYFRKVLAKHTGKTPTQLRKAAAKV